LTRFQLDRRHFVTAQPAIIRVAQRRFQLGQRQILANLGQIRPVQPTATLNHVASGTAGVSEKQSRAAVPVPGDGRLFKRNHSRAHKPDNRLEFSYREPEGRHAFARYALEDEVAHPGIGLKARTIMAANRRGPLAA
jgi:hypothetical protein